MSKDVHKLRASIFVDANVLIGAFRGLKADMTAMDYLQKLPQVKLFTSSLAVAQMIAACQRKGDAAHRQKLTNATRSILRHFSVISCTGKDIEQSLIMDQPDIEDNLQYVMGDRMKCTHYITNNKRDFLFANATIIPSAKIRLIGA